MVTIVKKVSKDEVIIDVIKFIFTTTIRYERIGDLWYNKKLHLQVTDYEMHNIPIEFLVGGKK